jgi:AbrB family looped-hinge helix DNA binding protein
MQTIRVSQGGRVVIPADLRELLHIEQGDELIMEARDGSLVITSKAERIRQVRDEIQAQLPQLKGISLADEVIAERRAEAEQDQSAPVSGTTDSKSTGKEAKGGKSKKRS